MHDVRFCTVVSLFFVLCAIASPAHAVDALNPFSGNPSAPRDNALVQPGVSYEGEGEIWTPTPQNNRKSDIVKWHWKLTIKKTDGEKFSGIFEWTHEGVIREKVSGTFTNGVTLAFDFTKQDKGGKAVGTINSQGVVKFAYSLPNADRLGEFSGTRSPPAGK